MFPEELCRALETGQDLAAALAEAAAPMRQAVLDALQQQPFEPFRIHMTAGYVHEIRQPEKVLLTPTTVQIGEPDPKRPGEFHARYVLALIHVVRLVPLAPDCPTIVQQSR